MRTMRKALIGAGIAAGLALFVACGSDSDDDDTSTDDDKKTTWADISSIVAAKCATSGCHDGSVAPDLRAENSWSELVAGGHVNLDLPDISLLYKTVTFEESPMPPGGPKISDLEVELILCWISEGAPNN